VKSLEHLNALSDRIDNNSGESVGDRVQVSSSLSTLASDRRILVLATRRAEIYQQRIPTFLLCIDHSLMQASVALNAKRKGVPIPNAVETSSDLIIEEKAC